MPQGEGHCKVQLKVYDFIVNIQFICSFDVYFPLRRTVCDTIPFLEDSAMDPLKKIIRLDPAKIRNKVELDIKGVKGPRRDPPVAIQWILRHLCNARKSCENQLCSL